MPQIRIEWVPVRAFGLGLFGFDHLQLVYLPSEVDGPDGQDAWFVMEGVREPMGTATFLGIEGANGHTTLSVANLAAREALIAKIGTPEFRGSRTLPYGGDEFQAWQTMASYARDIENQDFPYIAYGPPGSPIPTINSSSAVASLIYYSGLDPSSRLPFGVRLSPGIDTRLGTSGDDAMRIECGFTTLLGGYGRDQLVGGSDPHATEKLYGGPGNDLFHWSAGFDIIHGGQPQLDYSADGTDSVDYAGAGTVTIALNRYWVPHKAPNYIATFANGRDHLYSVERILWNDTTDRIILGAGVELIEEDVAPDPGERPKHPHLRSGLLIQDASASTARLLGGDGDDVLAGTPGDDTLYGGIGNDTLLGGQGSDGYVYLPGDGDDVIDDAGGAADTDVLVLAGGITPADVSLSRPAPHSSDLALALKMGGCIVIKNYFGGTAIERVVFDDGSVWTRTEMQRLAAAAPLGGRGMAVILNDGSDPATASEGELGPADFGPGAPHQPVSDPWQDPWHDLWHDLEAHASWLF
jgi:Ca2+-binding RTX toxin-like protein